MPSATDLVSASPPARGGGSPWAVWAVTPLPRAASIVVVSLAAAIITLEIVAAASGLADEPLGSALAQILLTGCFALFAVHPPTAALVLLGGASLALGSGGTSQTLLALALASGFVVVTCSLALTFAYAAGFLCWLGAVGLFVPGSVAPGWAAVLIVVALASAGVGFAVRTLRERASRLASALEEQRRSAEAAARAERRRIADELHDFIARELTIIVMHAGVLEHPVDEDTREGSRVAIKESARQALADIRRLLDLSESPERAPLDGQPAPQHHLRPTFDEVERELRSVGISVASEGLSSAERLSPTVDAALGRLLREASTNAVKHAGPGAVVTVGLHADADVATLRVENVAGRGPQDRISVPPSGYGLTRMRERMRVLGGSLEWGATASGWAVEAHVPVR